FHLPADCVGCASCFVLLLFEASASALLRAVWFEELEPPRHASPRTDSGALALRAFCFANASASASCFVLPIWTTFCSWPLPPQPDQQVFLPLVCVALASWSVLLSFDASASALFEAF